MGKFVSLGTLVAAQVLSFFMSQKAGTIGTGEPVVCCWLEPGPWQASPIASEGVSLLVPAYVIGARRTGMWLSKVERTVSMSSKIGSAWFCLIEVQGGVANQSI